MRQRQRLILNRWSIAGSARGARLATRNGGKMITCLWSQELLAISARYWLRVESTRCEVSEPLNFGGSKALATRGFNECVVSSCAPPLTPPKGRGIRAGA